MNSSNFPHIIFVSHDSTTYLLLLPTADVESQEECALATPRLKEIAFADQGKATSAADLLLVKVTDLAMDDSVRSVPAIRAEASATDDDLAVCC